MTVIAWDGKIHSGFTNVNSFVQSDMGCWVYEQNNPLPHRPDR